jgi:hypothetical protein
VRFNAERKERAERKNEKEKVAKKISKAFIKVETASSAVYSFITLVSPK